jgi:hypothetical protein
MKVEGMLNHVIGHNLNHVWIPYDQFENSHLKKVSFSNKDAINVVN